MALGLVAALPGCDGGETTPPMGGTVVLAELEAPRAANPLITADRYSDQMNRFLLYLPLVQFDHNLELVPGLARSWAMEGDTAAVLELHGGLRWSDGRPTTAEDVVFTLRRALDPGTGYPNRAQIGHVRAVEAVDSHTVRLSLDPVRQPLFGLAALPIMPSHAWDSVSTESLHSTPLNQRPVTNGRFRVVSARPGDRWEFEADTMFPEELGGRARLDRLVWRAIPESSAMAVELQSGEVDVGVGVRAEVFDRLESRDGYVGIERPELAYTAIAWNNRRPPLDDPGVRRALGLAMDRRQILDGLKNGHGTLANGPVPRAHWANAESVSPLSRDVERARTLLEERGLRDRDGDGVVEDTAGTPLSLTLLIPAQNDFNRDVGQLLQSNLREVGVELKLRQLEWGTLVQTIMAPDRDFDGALLALNADPHLDLRPFFHSEYMDEPLQVSGYSNPRADSVLEALATADEDRAPALFEELQRILAEDQPWTYLHGGSELIIARSRVNGIDAGLPGVLRWVGEWWVE